MTRQYTERNLPTFFTIDDYINKYPYMSFTNIKNGILDDFNFNLENDSDKIIPIVQLATPNDAKIISNLFKDVYEGKYPFKEMEDEKKIEDMIKSKNYIWCVFKIQNNKHVGCVGAKLNFETKKGCVFGFVIKREFQGITNNMRIFFLFIYYLWSYYKNVILVWTSEVRTYIKTPQFAESLVGFIPIGFLPNKDIFNDKIESEFLNIIYDKEVFNKYRSRKKIVIIKEVLGYFNYSQKKYGLESCELESPILNLNKKLLLELKDKITLDVIIEDNDITKIKILLEEYNSSLIFNYNIRSNNIENLEYHVSELEILVLFLRKLRIYINLNNIRYAECYVSAYKSKHQKIFLEAGFYPKGYIPCYQFNKKENNFEDSILFVYNKNPIDPHFEKNLIDETKKLYRLFQKGYYIENIQIKN